MKVRIIFEDGDGEFCDSVEEAIAYLEDYLPEG